MKQGSSPLNYITILTNIHIEQIMHINVSKPVTITLHVCNNIDIKYTYLEK